MKIVHDKHGCWSVSRDATQKVSIPKEVPHECTVPDCPGNRNRLKLEMFDEMLAALEYTRGGLTYDWHKRRDDLITKAKAIGRE